ncbi:glycosyl transferase [Tenacibaculum sp. KUL152]|nr:glycosyl transferase [Tenacibaculum sp. KUL152]
MKICAIGLRGIPNVMGGIESHCQQLYPRLVENGVDVTVIARSPYIEKKHSLYKGVKVVSVWAMRHKLLETFLHTFIAIFYARIFVRPDIIHIHAVGPALFTPLARLLGMKVVVTHHGADYDRKKWSSFAKSVLKIGEKLGIKWGNKTLVVGKTLSEHLKTRFAPQANRITFVPNGSLTSFAGKISESYIPEDLNIQAGRYVLAVGRLVPEKGFDDLVLAFRNADIDLNLVIVGDCDHEDEYSQNLRRMASDKVIFAGRRSGDALKALYQHASVFVLPSYHEGLPIVALEAISAGTSVILSDITPNLDIEAPRDSYFNVGNISLLSKKLKNIDSLDLFIDQKAFLKKFNWDGIALETLDHFSQVLSEQSLANVSESNYRR